MVALAMVTSRCPQGGWQIFSGLLPPVNTVWLTWHKIFLLILEGGGCLVASAWSIYLSTVITIYIVGEAMFQTLICIIDSWINLEAEEQQAIIILHFQSNLT